MLQLNNACKKFGSTMVLNQMNLSIQANTIVGLAGASGSGKSTLLRCMQQLESLDSGHIDFKGKSGFMFQDFQLFPHMTVFKNLVYAPMLHQTIENHEEKAIELLETLGLKDKAKAFPQELSGGQKQRVALARSLMMHPDLLLCDEPTSGLDMVTIEDVITLLSSVKGMGVTMVIASHDLEFLTKVAERVVVLKSGHVVADIQVGDLHDPLSYLKQQYQG
jgi:polar amino acid transport system ATP-binding protein